MAPTATLSGDVTIGAGCAVLHGAVVVAEGAPVTIGSDTVIMENAVLKASGGSAMQFPLRIGSRCIVGPQRLRRGAATIGDGCFVAAGARVFNGATLEDGSGVALGGIVHVKTRKRRKRSDAAHRFRRSGNDYRPEEPRVHAKMQFFADVFNLRATRCGLALPRRPKFLRKTHAQDRRSKNTAINRAPSGEDRRPRRLPGRQSLST